jgi:hypothetical protein
VVVVGAPVVLVVVVFALNDLHTHDIIDEPDVIVSERLVPPSIRV